MSPQTLPARLIRALDASCCVSDMDSESKQATRILAALAEVVAEA